MTRTPESMFLVFDEGIINVHDISTITPYKSNGLRWNGISEAYDGVRVTMQSKGTYIDLPGQTLTGLESRLNGAVF